MFLLSQRGGALSYNTAQAVLNKIIANSNCDSIIEKQITIHGLRHSLGTHLLNAGMSIERIAKMLGHQSIESTQIYTHLNKQLTTNSKANNDE